MTAITLMTGDHRRVSRLFREHDNALGNPGRQKVALAAVHRDLEIHARLEEELFYPALEDALSDAQRGRIATARSVHDEVKALLGDLAGMDGTHARYAGTFAKLRETVRRHVAEEETDLFPRAGRALGPVRLAQLGREMAERRSLLESEAPGIFDAAVQAAGKVVGGIVDTAATVLPAQAGITVTVERDRRSSTGDRRKPGKKIAARAKKTPAARARGKGRPSSK